MLLSSFPRYRFPSFLGRFQQNNKKGDSCFFVPFIAVFNNSFLRVLYYTIVCLIASMSSFLVCACPNAFKIIIRSGASRCRTTVFVETVLRRRLLLLLLLLFLLLLFYCYFYHYWLSILKPLHQHHHLLIRWERLL